MRVKILKISIVIPVYNEAQHLAACLEAIARQTVQPLEVIVVDNNSADNSVLVAQNFPFVRVIQEKRQGVVYARDRGFNEARGDILGRIDADTVIDADWVESLHEIFSNAEVAVVTGKVHYTDVALTNVVNAIDLHIRRRLARLLGREVAIQGANMALRAEVWRDIKADVCRKAGMHEDFDLAIHANGHGHLVQFDERLAAGIGYRQPGTSYRNFCSYVWLSPKTYALHGLKSRRHMYPIVALLFAAYPFIRLLCRGYDAQTESFSLMLAFRSKTIARVNPATFVD